jgi:UDP-N-acetyl-D-galactosamine dehydrogenase
MGQFVAEKTVKEMILAGHHMLGNAVTVLGLTFKENCPDTRNTRVIDIVNALLDFGLKVQVCDPQADADEAKHEYGLDLVPLAGLRPAAAIVAAVAHDDFRRLTLDDVKAMMGKEPVLIDVKDVFGHLEPPQNGVRYWRL